MRIEEAIKLQNARQILKNKKHNCITKANLGRILFPELKKKAPLVKMSYLINTAVTLRKEWIQIICQETGVDPNFLFGFDSVHDKDFKILIKNQ